MMKSNIGERTGSALLTRGKSWEFYFRRFSGRIAAIKVIKECGFFASDFEPSRSSSFITRGQIYLLPTVDCRLANNRKICRIIRIRDRVSTATIQAFSAVLFAASSAVRTIWLMIAVGRRRCIPLVSKRMRKSPTLAYCRYSTGKQFNHLDFFSICWRSAHKCTMASCFSHLRDVSTMTFFFTDLTWLNALKRGCVCVTFLLCRSDIYGLAVYCYLFFYISSFCSWN